MEWISVKDEKPKEGQPVLCCYDFADNTPFVCIYDNDEGMFVEVVHAGWAFAKTPTHWMPLPPPKQHEMVPGDEVDWQPEKENEK